MGGILWQALAEMESQNACTSFSVFRMKKPHFIDLSAYILHSYTLPEMQSLEDTGKAKRNSGLFTSVPVFCVNSRDLVWGKKKLGGHNLFSPMGLPGSHVTFWLALSCQRYVVENGLTRTSCLSLPASHILMESPSLTTSFFLCPVLAVVSTQVRQPWVGGGPGGEGLGGSQMKDTKVWGEIWVRKRTKGRGRHCQCLGTEDIVGVR